MPYVKVILQDTYIHTSMYTYRCVCVCVIRRWHDRAIHTHMTLLTRNHVFASHVCRFYTINKQINRLESTVNKGKAWIWLCIIYANGIKLVFQEQHFLYVIFFLDQSMVLYFFQDQVQTAQPSIQGSPWVSRLFCQYFLTWTLNSTQTGVHTTTLTQNEHFFICSFVCVIFPKGSILHLFSLTL